jgi:hypothetical protein
VDKNVRPIQVKNAVEKFDFCHSELVIGLVCAVGTDYEPIRLSLVTILSRYGYSSRVIKISDLITRLSEAQLPDSPETIRISSRMTAGNDLCRKTKRKDVWALAAITEINANRPVDSSGPNAQPRVAHIVLSLKRPHEVATLRKVYGDGFFLVGVFATENERLDYLIERNAPKDEAIKLIKRDAEETGDDYGQYTTETFQLSDVFVQSRKTGSLRRNYSGFLIWCFPIHTLLRRSRSTLCSWPMPHHYVLRNWGGKWAPRSPQKVVTFLRWERMTYRNLVAVCTGPASSIIVITY